MKILLLLCLILSTNVFAKFNYNFARNDLIFQELSRRELNGWKNESTSSSIRLELGCEVEAEFHLAGDHQKNYLLVGITNRSSSEVKIVNQDIAFILNGKRATNTRLKLDSQQVAAGNWVMYWVPFPSKKDFKNVETIDIEIPVLGKEKNQTCLIKSTFRRVKKVKTEWTEFSAGEIAFAYGPSLSTHGNLKDLGTPSGNFIFEYNFFPRPSWGLGLVLYADQNIDGSKKDRVNDRFEKNDQYTASSLHIGYQAIYRKSFNDYLSLQYGFGLGYLTINDIDEDDEDSTLTSALGFTQLTSLNWCFLRSEVSAREVFEWKVGVGLSHYYVPDMEIGGEDLDGHRFGSFVRLSLGL